MCFDKQNYFDQRDFSSSNWLAKLGLQLFATMSNRRFAEDRDGVSEDAENVLQRTQRSIRPLNEVREPQVREPVDEGVMVRLSKSQRIQRLETEVVNLRNKVEQLQYQNTILNEQLNNLDVTMTLKLQLQRNNAKDLEKKLSDKYAYHQKNEKLLSLRIGRQNSILKNNLQGKIERMQKEHANKVRQIKLEFQHRIKIAKQQYIEYSQKFYQGHILRLKKSINKKFEDLGHGQMYSSKVQQKKKIQQIKLHRNLSSRKIERQ